MNTRKPSPLDGNDEYIKTHTKKEVAEHFGVNYNHVLNWLRGKDFNTIPQRRHKCFCVTDEFREYASTHTINQTAEYFDICYATAYCAIRTNNITPLRVKVKEYDRNFPRDHRIKIDGEAKDMIRELNKKFSQSSISRVFGYTKQYIQQICKED